jgi:hypothetical protein
LINSDGSTKTESGSSPRFFAPDVRDMTFTVRMSLHNCVSGEGRVGRDVGVLVFKLLSFDLETGTVRWRAAALGG